MCVSPAFSSRCFCSAKLNSHTLICLPSDHLKGLLPMPFGVLCRWQWLSLSLCLGLSLAQLPAAFPFFPPYTRQQDVDAINDLYTCLGSPAALSGWSAYGGDPCLQDWEGVQCAGPRITTIVVKGAHLEGKLSERLGNFTSVITLDLSNNHIGGTIPQNLPPSIRQLDLSWNELSGQLPGSMDKLNSLSRLHVQNNQLHGTLDVLGDLPLKDLNVENNAFSGYIPQKLLPIPNFQRGGNHFDIPIADPSPPPATTMPSRPPDSSMITPAIPSSPLSSYVPLPPPHDVQQHAQKVSLAKKAAGYGVLAATSLALAALLLLFSVSEWRRSKSFHVEMDKEPVTRTLPMEPFFSSSSSNSDNVVSDAEFHRTEEECQSSAVPLTFFSVASLQQYTSNFSDENLIRETDLGRIYLAEHSGSKFSVLNITEERAKMRAGDFVDLAQSISRLRHPNIEELVGCCAEHGQRLLVYKYFSEKTLDDVLHSEDDPSKKLSWNARIHVALQAAKALEYLHEGCHEHVFHRPVKPGNVLIDADLRVRVSGCGLAPFVSSDLAPQLSNCCSDALSYEPPEVNQCRPALWNEKGDIYSFGVMLLQLLTGRKPYDSSRPRGERLLVRWAATQLHDIDALKNMVDPHCLIGGTLSVRSLSRFADVISRCIQQEAEFRAVMSEVVQDLRRTLEDGLQSSDGEGFRALDGPALLEMQRAKEANM